MSKEKPEEAIEMGSLMKKAFSTMIRDSEENQAIREKYAKESQNKSKFFNEPRQMYYEIRLHLTKAQLLKLIEALEP